MDVRTAFLGTLGRGATQEDTWPGVLGKQAAGYPKRHDDTSVFSKSTQHQGQRDVNSAMQRSSHGKPLHLLKRPEQQVLPAKLVGLEAAGTRGSTGGSSKQCQSSQVTSAGCQKAACLPAAPQLIPTAARRPVPDGTGKDVVGADQDPPGPSTQLKPEFTVGQVLQRIKMLLQPTNSVEHQFYTDCYVLCNALRDPSTNACSIPLVALALRAKGYDVVVRKILDSKMYWTKSMSNTFCYCVLRTGPQQQPVGYVIDPNFKELFRTAHMADRCRDIWECLPALFAGPATQLAPLVQLLCYELALSFQELQMQLPPWRTYAACIGRWLSKVAVDVQVPLVSNVQSQRHVVLDFQSRCKMACKPQQEASTCTSAGSTSSRSSSGSRYSGEQVKIVVSKPGAPVATEVRTVVPLTRHKGFAMDGEPTCCAQTEPVASSSQDLSSAIEPSQQQELAAAPVRVPSADMCPAATQQKRTMSMLSMCLKREG